MEDTIPYVATAADTAPRRAWAETGIVFVASAVVVATLAATKGGYFWSSWSWACLALAASTTAALLIRTPTRLGLPSAAFLGLLLAFVGWTLLSLAWSPSGAPVFEAERTLVYATGVAAVLVAVRRRAVPALLGGVLLGLALIDLYALGTRLLPDRLGSPQTSAADRLAAPIGYWNGLGAATVLAALLALGFAVRGRTVVSRAASALTLPALLPALYFTFSRGSWIALAFALLVLVAVDARRLQLVTVSAFVLAPTAVALVLAWRSSALGRTGGTLAAAEHDGHRLALWVAILGIASAGIAAVAYFLEQRVSAGVAARRAYGGILAAAAVAGVVVAVALGGGPENVVRRGWHSFTGSAVQVQVGQQENTRLFSLSNNNRTELWRAAWQEAKAHPALGGGAGSYAAWWLAHRKSTATGARRALALSPDLCRNRGRRPRAPCTRACDPARGSIPRSSAAVRAVRTGCLSRGYLIHAAGDWDWQLAGVTLPAVLVGAALVISARGDESAPLRQRFRLAAVVAAGAAVVRVVSDGARERPAHARILGGRQGPVARVGRRGAESRTLAPLGSRTVAPLRRGATCPPKPRRGERGTREAHSTKDPKSWQLWFDLSAASTGKPAERALARSAELNPLSPEIDQLRKFPAAACKGPAFFAGSRFRYRVSSSWRRREEISGSGRRERSREPSCAVTGRSRGPELIERLTSHVAEESRRHRRPRARIAAVAIAVVAMLAAFGAFGGIGYAASAIKTPSFPPRRSLRRRSTRRSFDLAEYARPTAIRTTTRTGATATTRTMATTTATTTTSTATMTQTKWSTAAR